MQGSENIIAVIRKILYGNLRFDLYLTDKRIVVIHGVDLAVFGLGAFPAIIGEGIQKFTESRKEHKEKTLTLGELLQRDKKSFAISYGDLERVKLHKSRWLAGTLNIKSKEIKKTFTLTKVQFEQLSRLLPSIDLLQGKLEID